MKALRLTLPVLYILLQSGCASVDRTLAHKAYVVDKTSDVLPFINSQQGPAAGRPALLPAPAEDDFWQRLRGGFSLPGSQQEAVQRQCDTYSRNAAHVEKIFERGSPYMAYILSEVEKRGLPNELVLLPFVESAYDPYAYSNDRAAGLWQFIPGTGRLYGLDQDWWYDGRRDVIASTRAALDHLGKLHAEFDGDWLLALAAYNSGSGTVHAAIRRNKKAGRPTDFWHLKLPRETAAYIPRLLAISAIVKQPGRFGIALSSVDPEPAFGVVDTHGQLDIGVAAELASMDTEKLYQLNPGFNRWATRPGGPHRLAIPVDKTDTFMQGLEELPPEKRLKWVRHTIKRGETLSHIARRYDTTVAVLRSTNKLPGDRIRAGQHLLVAVAARDPAVYAVVRSGPAAGGHGGGGVSYEECRRQPVVNRETLPCQGQADQPVEPPGPGRCHQTRPEAGAIYPQRRRVPRRQKTAHHPLYRQERRFPVPHIEKIQRRDQRPAPLEWPDRGQVPAPGTTPHALYRRDGPVA